MSLALAWLGHFLPGGALFAGINLVLALFNLLPVSGLDGGGRYTAPCAPWPDRRQRSGQPAFWTDFW